MVLSAGFGTRLAPLTDEIPKPLVPVGNRPLLLRILENLGEQGARKLLVNAHHKSAEILNSFSELSLNVEVLHEENILGTAGGVAAAYPRLKQSPLVVVNGDIVGELPLGALLERGVETMRLAVTPQEIGRGTVGIGAGGQVVRLRGEVFGEEIASGDYMGVACLGEACLRSLPKVGCLIGDWALPWLRAGRSIEVALVDCEFDDIGTPDAYWSANMKWLQSRRLDSLVDPSVEVAAGATVSGSLVGEGAKIRGEGVLRECVVLPGAEVQVPLERAIVTPAGVIMHVGGALGSPPKAH